MLPRSADPRRAWALAGLPSGIVPTRLRGLRARGRGYIGAIDVFGHSPCHGSGRDGSTFGPPIIDQALVFPGPAPRVDIGSSPPRGRMSLRGERMTSSVIDSVGSRIAPSDRRAAHPRTVGCRSRARRPLCPAESSGPWCGRPPCRRRLSGRRCCRDNRETWRGAPRMPAWFHRDPAPSPESGCGRPRRARARCRGEPCPP